MAFGLGHQTYVMVGEESTYGTAVARTHGFYHSGDSMDQTENDVPAGDIGRVGTHTGTVPKGLIVAGGSIDATWRLGNRALLKMLKHLLGSVASSQPDITTAPTAYLHTFGLAAALPTGLSIEVHKGFNSHLFDGCKVESCRFSGSAGQNLQASFGIIAQERTTVGSPTALVLSEVEGKVPNLNDSSVSWNGSAVGVVQSLSISIANSLTRINSIDSRKTAEPQRNGRRVVSGTFTFLSEDETLLTDYDARTDRAAIITINGATIAGAFKNYIKFNMPVARLTGASRPSDRPGPLAFTASFVGYTSDAASEEIIVTAQNELAAV